MLSLLPEHLPDLGAGKWRWAKNFYASRIGLGGNLDAGDVERGRLSFDGRLARVAVECLADSWRLNGEHSCGLGHNEEGVGGPLRGKRQSAWSFQVCTPPPAKDCLLPSSAARMIGTGLFTAHRRHTRPRLSG